MKHPACWALQHERFVGLDPVECGIGPGVLAGCGFGWIENLRKNAVLRLARTLDGELGAAAVAEGTASIGAAA
jgi:hypothetical protein